MEINFIFSEIMRLKHVYFLLNLLDNLLNRILVSPGCNGVLMYPLDGRSRNIQTFYINLPTGKYRRNLIQQSGKVL